MREYHLKVSPTASVLGLSFEGDYIVAINGSQYTVIAKADFESKYEIDVPVAPPAAAPPVGNAPPAPEASPAVSPEKPQAPDQPGTVKDGYAGQ